MPVRINPFTGLLEFEALPYGLIFLGTCNADMTASKTAIYCANLSGYGADYFNDNSFYMYVFKNANSAGAAPVGDYPRKITDYTNAGVFAVDAFSANVEALDEVYLIHKSILASTRTTSLAITGTKAAGSTYSVTSAGANYTKAGDDADLLASAALFNAAESISIFLNGVCQDKGTHAVWASATSFTLDVAVDNGDEILILTQ
jgi:hypothetical protein